jgi:hypothetical protein
MQKKNNGRKTTRNTSTTGRRFFERMPPVRTKNTQFFAEDKPKFFPLDGEKLRISLDNYKLKKENAKMRKELAMLNRIVNNVILAVNDLEGGDYDAD